MNYQDFIKFKEHFLSENSDVINLSENNLYKYFNYDNSFDNNIKGHVNGNVHRCHLVEDWLEFFGLEQMMKPKIGVSEGVRNSLEIISKHLSNKKWYIPEDVYPFYQNLMKKENIQFEEYNTLTSELIFDNIKADVILFTYPLKPSGKNISTNEFNSLERWLNEDNNRRVIFDSVYLNNIQNLNLLLNKFGHKQAYYLFSLSKIFCLPKVFGISILPEEDISLREDFKNLNISKMNLNLAYQALNHSTYKDRNLNILSKYFTNYIKTREIIELPQFNGGYLFYIEDNFYDLLERGILSIPPSVFGSKNNKGSIISTLI